MERIVGKIGLNRVNARDLKALQLSLEYSLEVLDELENDLKIKYHGLEKGFFKELANKISKFIVDNPPNTISEGGIVRDGYSKEIDELKSLSKNSRIWLEEFEEKERKSTGISSLKVSYNNVFGYYIEVTKAHYNKVPERYIRKQTLVNSERFITQELKEKEEIILNAHEKLSQLELKLFNEFRETLLPNLEKLKELLRK